MADDFGLFDTDTPAPNPGTGEDGKPEKAPELVYGTAKSSFTSSCCSGT